MFSVKLCLYNNEFMYAGVYDLVLYTTTIDIRLRVYYIHIK